MYVPIAQLIKKKKYVPIVLLSSLIGFEFLWGDISLDAHYELRSMMGVVFGGLRSDLRGKILE